MNKKLLIVGAIFIIVLTAVLLFFRQQPGTLTGPAVSPTLAPPAPTGIFQQPPNVAFSFASPPVIPATLPTYVTNPLPLTSVEQTANKAVPALGLSASASTIIRGNSYTKTWSRGNDASLKITQTGDSISVSFTQSKTNQTPGSITPDVAVQQFLLLLIPPTTGFSIRASGTSPGPFDGLLVLDTPPPVSFQNYFYTYILSSYPVLTAGLSLTPISVIADSGGIIRFAYIVPPPASYSIAQTVSLLSPDQVLVSLTAGRGTLLDTYNPQNPEQGAVPNFSKFVIETAQIVYAPKNNTLLPALYMTGTGSSSSGTSQKATIFLWLTPDADKIQP